MPVTTNSEALMQIQMAVIPAIKITSWAGRVLQENQVLPKLLNPSAGE